MVVADVGRNRLYAGTCWDCGGQVQFERGLTLREFTERMGSRVVYEVTEEVKVG